MIPKEVLNTIRERPYEFNWIHLMRLLYLHQDGDQELNRQLVGYENSPLDEVVRFKTTPRLRHHASEIRAIESLADNRFSVEVSFLGLIGAAGVLPHHYSQTVLDRLKENDETMRNFFDLFHHRVISNFFRASVKYRLPFQHELFSRFKADSKTRSTAHRLKRIEKDSVSNSIASLVGLGEPSLQNRREFDDRILMFYAGQFSSCRPTLIGLMRMLQEFTGTNIDVKQFQFEWLYLESSDQTALSQPGKQLGQSVVIGNRVGSILNRFRIRLGPLSWNQFQQLLPHRKRLKKIAQFTRSYVGIGLDFDFQLVLRGPEAPTAQLGNEDCGRLGWNTWIMAEPIKNDIEDVVFEIADGFA